MRIYGKFEDVGSEYETVVPVEISLNPFNEGICRYLDLEEGKTYSCIEDESEDWKMYSGKSVDMGEYLYNPKTKEYINSRIVEGCFGQGEDWVKLEDGRRFDEDGYDGEYCTYAGGYESEWHMFQNYENGEPIGEPYFKLF